jgi:hypothetical protein
MYGSNKANWSKIEMFLSKIIENCQYIQKVNLELIVSRMKGCGYNQIVCPT